jgi:hypothetical protein
MQRPRRRIGVWFGLAAGTVALAAAAGCSGSAPSSSSAMAMQAGSTTVPQPAPSAPATSGSQTATGGALDEVPVAAPDVILTGSMTVQVGSNGVEKAFQAASEDATAVGGFVAASDSQLSGKSPYADLTLRVPAKQLDTVVGQVGGLGKVQQQQLGGQDVTGQVIDLGARIANLESEETALRQLMSRTGSIPDILQVENQLFSVEQQLEELTAQRDGLASQVAYATLTLDLVTPGAVPPKPQPPVNAGASGARLALHNSAAVLHGLAIAAGAAFPAILLAAAAGLILLIRRRRRTVSPAAASRA